MKAIISSLSLFVLFTLNSSGQDIKNLPGSIQRVNIAEDCAITWCGECDGELKIRCNETLNCMDKDVDVSKSLRFNVIAKKMPQDEVAFFYRNTENRQFGEKIIPRIHKELKAGDVVWFNRINYRNTAGELIESDGGFMVVLK